MNRIFDSPYPPENSRKFAYPPNVRCKITYFGGLTHGRTHMPPQRHLGARFWRCPSPRFRPRVRDLVGVCNMPRRTKKSLGVPGYSEPYGVQFLPNLDFSGFLAHFQGSYLNELLLGLSSDPFETWHMGS